MNNEKLYPIGIQTFDVIRQENRYYVDKTSHVYRLAHTDKYYFLSRPRRFGKSLLVSTLEAYFTGRRELFEGLAIETMEQEWTTYPVLHLDLNQSEYNEEGNLSEVLGKTLNDWEKIYGKADDETSISQRFQGIVQRAYEQTGRQVVVLIDEYDKPLISTLLNKPLQSHYRTQLKAFYGVLKKQDAYIRFALLTGVTKFSKVSIFSDLNHLKDISLHPAYSDICGITEEEIHRYFEPQLVRMAEEQGLSYELALKELQSMYDGYRFAPHAAGVFNPFSLLNALQDANYGNYWFATGTPTFLFEALRRSRYRLANLTREKVTADVLGDIDTPTRSPLPLLYQSGYLTLAGDPDRFGRYPLRFPNREVELGFLRYLMPCYTQTYHDSDFDVGCFVEDVEAGEADRFMRRLQTLFADSTYELVGSQELYFHNVLYLVFRLMGLFTEVERHLSDGRMDMVVQTPDYIYIFECKLDRSAREALQQIEDRGYARPFAMDPRKLYKVGVNFSSETRGISEYEIYMH